MSTFFQQTAQAMIAPAIMPTKAPVAVIRFQTSDKITTGPKAAPKPDILPEPDNVDEYL